MAVSVTCGVNQVKYLGLVFSAKGMEADSSKTLAVCDWSTPTDAANLRSFLGLASYYRRYIHKFADIAAPLYQLTNKGALFEWTKSCQLAFNELKHKLTEAPVLMGQSASTLWLICRAVCTTIRCKYHWNRCYLRASRHVVAYASRPLSSSERNYSVIQREYLAIIFALKQFWHYLLGHQFSLFMDHAPLQWLSSQKLEGLLARWALSFQEYDFTITYRKGTKNQNADALSRQSDQLDDHTAATAIGSQFTEDLKLHQSQDRVICQLYDALSHCSKPPRTQAWSQLPLCRYCQLWLQLLIKNGLVCRHYTLDLPQIQ